jgi:Ca-activated chloride channel family protein
MEFLNPTALYGLLALPLLLIPYLIRRKPQRIVFSSLLLFAQPGMRAGGRPLGRLRLPLIFFLQLLLLTLLILALGEPVFSVRASNIAIVLDNSASMQTLEGQQTRFALAQERARGLLAELGPGGKVDLYRTVPRFEKLRATPLGSTEAASAINAQGPYDLADTPTDYPTVLNQMANEQKYDRLYFITDHPSAGQTDVLRVLTVGQPKGNFAISSFHVTRSSLVTSGLEATADVANFSTKDERIKVVLKSGANVVSTKQLLVAAGSNSSVTFEGLPARPYYEAELDVRDALPLDNRSFAVPPPAQGLRILGVSPRPQALMSLRSLGGLSLDVISPNEYANTDRTGYGLEIFHFSNPAVLPQNPALFVLPPDNNPLADPENPVSSTMVSSWREPHPLTRYVNFALFRPPYARPLRPRTSGEAVIQSPAGILAFATESRGVRQLVLGFDLFPYLGRQNLPVSVFTLNILDWFSRGSQGAGSTTGEALSFATTQQGNVLITPRNQKIVLKPGSNRSSATLFQGIYQLDRGTYRELFAVNLGNRSESNLSEPTPIEIRGAHNRQSSMSALFTLWPYLLLISLLLLFIEWFVSPGRAQTALPLGHR